MEHEKNANKSTRQAVEMSPEQAATLEALTKKAMADVEETIRKTAESAGAVGAERVINEHKEKMAKEADQAIKEAAARAGKSIESSARLEKGSRVAFYLTGTAFMLGSMAAAGLSWNKNRKNSAVLPEPTPAKAR